MVTELKLVPDTKKDPVQINTSLLRAIRERTESMDGLPAKDLNYVLDCIERLMDLYQNTMKAKELGKIHGSRTMFLCVEAGDMEDDNGNKYLCRASATSYAPMIFSEQTNKKFVMSWEELVSLAVLKGIDRPEDGKDREG